MTTYTADVDHTIALDTALNLVNGVKYFQNTSKMSLFYSINEIGVDGNKGAIIEPGEWVGYQAPQNVYIYNPGSKNIKATIQVHNADM